MGKGRSELGDTQILYIGSEKGKVNQLDVGNRKDQHNLNCFQLE